MKILVTGGNGFIATNFNRLLLEKNYYVDSLDNLSYASNKVNHSDFLSDDNFTFIHSDIRNDEIYEYIKKNKYTAVINFAAESHVDRSIKNDSEFLSTNINGTHNLIRACKRLISERVLKSDFKFIQISTDEVYGSLNNNDNPFTESSILKPSNPYSATKASADLLCLSYYKTYEFPVIVSRCSNNYGPYQHPEKLIPLSISKVKQDLKVPIYGNGQQIRDWIHVDDHCRGILAVLENGVTGQIYNFGGSSELANIDCVKTLIENLKPGKNPKKYMEFVKDRPGHDIRYAIDSSKAFQQLSWEAQNTFSQGIAKTISWYSHNSKWLEDITNNEEYKKWEKTNY